MEGAPQFTAECVIGESVCDALLLGSVLNPYHGVVLWGTGLLEVKKTEALTICIH